jgi:hypothetical protein
VLQGLQAGFAGDLVKQEKEHVPFWENDAADAVVTMTVGRQAGNTCLFQGQGVLLASETNPFVPHSSISSLSGWRALEVWLLFH